MGVTGEDNQVNRNELHKRMLGFGHQGKASWEAVKVEHTKMKAKFVRTWWKGTYEMDTV